MRVAILGAGGLGALYGGLLARSGADVSFIARGANLEALRRRGLTVRSSFTSRRPPPMTPAKSVRWT